MFDTHVTVVGNVLNEPELRWVKDETVPVVAFRVASNSRRFDRLANSWVDGPSLRLRVICWRRLAESIRSCVHVGDPVVVTGRLRTRDWMGDDNVRHVSYELEATTVGHDLSRGFDKFTRHRASRSTIATEDAETDRRIAGERAEPMPAFNNRILNRTYDADLGGFITTAERDPFEHHPFGEEMVDLTTGDDSYVDEAARVTSPDEDGDTDTDTDTDSDPDSDGAPEGSATERGDTERGDTESGDTEGGDTESEEQVEPVRRRRRRQPVGV
jgi:single-strand DNA-binding protein